MTKATASASAHDHDHCIAEALERAEVVCKAHGLRFTRQRRRVLELVWDSHRPVGAYDILDALNKEGKRHGPPIVYRALEFLIEAGLVHRLDSLNAYIGCADPEHAHGGQFLICRDCRLVIELDDTGIDQRIGKVANERAFLAESIGIEVQGLCNECRD